MMNHHLTILEEDLLASRINRATPRVRENKAMLKEKESKVMPKGKLLNLRRLLFKTKDKQEKPKLWKSKTMKK